MKHFIFLFIFFAVDGFSQIISTVAGTGVASYTGDGGPAINATFSEPQAVAFDKQGNLYVVDEDDNVIRKINSSGIITTVAGVGLAGYSGDHGPATSAKFTSPSGIAIDTSGNIFIADTYNNVIRKIDKSGIITTVAGSGPGGYGGDGGLATSAFLNLPEGVAVDLKGNIFIADAANHRIRKVDTAGFITTIAGTGTAGFAGDNGPSILSKLNYPIAIVVDTASRVIFIADQLNHRVRKIRNDSITTIAGTGTAGYSGDHNSANAAQLNSPSGLALDSAGTLYIADAGNSRIRKINTNGIITTYAGNGTAGFGGDNGPAFLAEIYSPPGITCNRNGDLFIAEYFNSRVRKVSFCKNPLQLYITSDTTICLGDSITIAAFGAATYTWSTSASNDSIIVKPQTLISYSVVGVAGECAAIDSVQITVIACNSSISTKLENQILIYPNPAGEKVFVFGGENFDFKLQDLSGRVVLQGKVNDYIDLEAAKVVPGAYILRIHSANGILLQRTIIKN